MSSYTSGVGPLVALLLMGTPPSPAPSPSGTPPPRRVEIQGHRGARALLPENTLPAFRHAIAVGADVLEFDVHVTRDDQLVVTHDPLISPALCTGPGGAPITGELAIRALTLAEVQRYDCGSKPNPRFPRQKPVPGTPMPSLAEVLELARATPLRVNVEAKTIPGRPDLYPPTELYARLLVDALRAHRMLDRATVQSFDHRILRAVRARAPQVVLAALIEENFVDHLAVVRAAQASILSPPHLWITAEVVRDLHAAGIRVIPWTANTPEEWRRLLDLDVDGIITDDPAGLTEWLRAQHRR